MRGGNRTRQLPRQPAACQIKPGPGSCTLLPGPRHALVREAGVEHAGRHGRLQPVVRALKSEAQIPHASSHQVRVCSLGSGLHGEDEPGKGQPHSGGQLLGLAVVQQPYPAPCSTASMLGQWATSACFCSSCTGLILLFYSGLRAAWTGCSPAALSCPVQHGMALVSC